MVEENLKEGISIKGAIKLLSLMFILQAVISILFDIVAVVFEAINLGGVSPYVEVLGKVVSYIYVIKKVLIKRGYQIDLGLKPTKIAYIAITLLTFGYILVYDNSLEPLLANIKQAEWVVEIFNELLENKFIAYMSIVVIAPIFEEIIFRGFVFKEFLKRYSLAKAIIFSSLIFGIIHMNIHQGVATFFLGTILAVIYYKSNSLLLCILIHFINNLFCLLVIYHLPVYEQMMTEFNLGQLLLGAVLIISSLWIFNNYKIVSEEKFALEFKGSEETEEI